MTAHKNLKEPREQSADLSSSSNNIHSGGSPIPSDAIRSLGKSSNSSNETVIARIEPPSPTFKDIKGLGVEQNCLKVNSASSNGIFKLEDEVIMSNIVSNGRHETIRSEVTLRDQVDNRSETEAEIKREIDTEMPELINQKHQRNSNRLKNLLMLANHLNPFNHNSANNNSSSWTQSKPNRKSSSGHSSSTFNGDNHSNSQQRASLLNLLLVAQRYLSGSSRQSCDLSASKRSNQNVGDQTTSKSAPVTPVKWQSLAGANGYLTADHSSEPDDRVKASARDTNSKANSNDRLKSSKELSSNSNSNSNISSPQQQQQQQQRPSVRFFVEPRSSRFSDCAVQTSIEAVDSMDEMQMEPSDDLVARLFGSVAKESPEGIAGETPMDSKSFQRYGYKLIDYISNYMDTIRDRRVTPLNIEPGYLKSLIQADAPEKGESFGKIMQDFENHIMCGLTHWQHPHFHAYFPAGNAYPSILADMLSDGLGCVGFSWAASPAYTELEIIMLDWMGKMIGLPDEFLCLSGDRNGQKESKGGGVIQSSASECVLVNLLAARHWAIDKLRKKYPNTPDGMLLSKLIGYCSKEAHSCVEKAAMIGFIRMRTLETDEKHSLRGETLAKAIAHDITSGLEPFIVCATLGTTSCVSFDNLEELGKVCQEHDIWLHVDAAYAGSALICPEFKYLMRGIELASSFNMNPNKWLLINFDCSLMWVKDRFKLTRAFVVDPLYLQHSFSDQAIDYRHWGIPLSRRFRALKLWFVIRNYGVEGLRAYIRNHVKLAKLFEQLIRNDSRFTINNEVVLGLVCFRLIGSNALNQRLLSMINASGKLHMVPASLNGRYVIRFCVCDQNAQEADIRYAYKCISDFATELFESIRAGRERIRAISQQSTIDVSSISLNTQQSTSGDRLNNSSTGETNVSSSGQMSADLDKDSTSAIKQQVAVALGSRDSTIRQLMSRRNSRGTTNTQLDQQRLVARSPLTKQVSMQPEQQSNASGEHEEQQQDFMLLDSMATIDGTDFDLDLDDDLWESQYLDHEQLARAGDVTGAGVSPTDGQLDSRSPECRRWYSRAGSRSSRNQTTGGLELEETDDEVFTLGERRSKTCNRYKREFFVRVVSDPRVYRASISGDINAHASCCSLAGSSSAVQATHHHHQEQQQSTAQVQVQNPPQMQESQLMASSDEQRARSSES